MSYKPNFNNRHPDYLRMCDRWKMGFDFYLGGLNVLSPDRDVTPIEFGSLIKDFEEGMASGLDSELPRLSSTYEWISGSAQSYLWKHDRETLRQYQNRCAKLMHFPIFQSVINIFVAGVLKTGPKRGSGEQLVEPWLTYHNDIDLRGTDIDTFLRQALSLALVFGRVHVITDRPSFETPAINLAHELARNDRPYSYLISPLSITDWSLNEYGNFEWAVICEEMQDYRLPGENPIDRSYQYRVWYPDHWELWQPADEQSTEFFLAGSGSHPVGRVPIDTIYTSRSGHNSPMLCESFLADVLDIDRVGLNIFSEIMEVSQAQSFSILWLPESEGSGSGPVDIGPFSAISSSAEGGSPKYISPDTTLVQTKWNLLQDIYHLVRQFAGVGRGRAEYSKEERSASAISYESQDKINQMSQLAASVEFLDHSLHRTYNAWLGRNDDDYPTPSYTKQFDLKAVMVAIQELVQLKATDSIPKKAMAELAKPIVNKILRENGISQNEIVKIEKEIEEEAGKESEPIITSNNLEKADSVIKTD